MNDQEKIAVLKASISNMGRLIPAGMTITISRSADGGQSVMDQTYSDGTKLTAVFVGHTPIYSIPVVPAEYGMAQ